MCIYSTNSKTLFTGTVHDALRAGGVIHCYCTELDVDAKLSRLRAIFSQSRATVLTSDVFSQHTHTNIHEAHCVA